MDMDMSNNKKLPRPPLQQYWKDKVIGWSILCLVTTFWLVQLTILSATATASSITTVSCTGSYYYHNKVLLVLSFLNSISHMAVILNLLQEGLVLFILVGVIFDVMTSLLYINTHMNLTVAAFVKVVALQTENTNNNLLAWALLFLPLAIHSLVDLSVHVKALAVFYLPNKNNHAGISLVQLKSVVQSAHNNIQGHPGKNYQDHLFAFSDTAKHVAFFVYALLYTTSRNDSMDHPIPEATTSDNNTTGLLIVTALMIVLMGNRIGARQAWSSLQHVVLSWGSQSTTTTTTIARSEQYNITKLQQQATKERTTPTASLTIRTTATTNSDLELATCNCPVCQNKTCFAIVLPPRMCELWHCTFEELLDKIDDTTAT